MTETIPAPEQAQEKDVSEASPQIVEQELASGPTTPKTPQDFYWRRQAEKLEKELAAVRAEREAEANRLSRDRDEAVNRALESEQREKRLALLAEAGLPEELTELVPEGDPETVTAAIEKLKPIAEKLKKPSARGLMNTNPPNAAGREEARLERLRAEAARGDRRALREYAHLRDKLKRTL